MRKLNIKPKLTQRGFLRADFKDLNGQQCSIQESSLATDRAIWLGCNEGGHYLGTKPVEKIEYECAARMHLNRHQAFELILVLLYFVITGLLPGGKK